MATAEVATNTDREMEENAREQREILSRYFSQARQRLNEREAQLSLQLEEKIHEIKIHNKTVHRDTQQLQSVLEYMRAGLSSNTLQDTGNEAVKPIIEKLYKLEVKRMKFEFRCFPDDLYNEIDKIGEITSIPLSTQTTCISDHNNSTEENKFYKLVLPPPYDQQKSQISFLLNRPLQKGKFLQLLHMKWYKQWKRYVGYDNCDKSSAGEEVAKPGPVDNSSLLDQGRLRKEQVEEIDYKLVPEEGWNKLLSWYGITRDSMGIQRQVVEYGKFIKQCKVEVYPIELKACLYPKESDFKLVTISRCDTIQTLENMMRELFNIHSTKQTRLYNRYMTYTYELIKDKTSEVQVVGLFDGQCVLLEVQNVDGTWPRPGK